MILLAPLAGTIRDLADVPDPVFAERLLGDGVAIAPDLAEILVAHAPCDGDVVKVFPGGHAIVIDGGVGPFLLHFGLETVELHGEGLRPCVAEGDRVAAGAPIVEIQAAALRERGINLVSPIVGISAQAVRLLAPAGSRITLGEPLLELLASTA